MSTIEGYKNTKHHFMHQTRPVTRIVHLLNEQDDSDSPGQCGMSSSVAKPTVKTNEASHTLTAKDNNRISKQMTPSKRHNEEKLHSLSSELSSKSELIKPFNEIAHMQNKAKTSVQFNVEQIRATKLLADDISETKKIFHEGSGLFYYLSSGTVPFFKVLRSQVPDPILFYESTRDLGEQYGCIKLKFCDTSDARQQSYNKFGANPDQFWFRATTQFSGSLEANKRHMLEFYKGLLQFHEMRQIEGSTLSKVPSINKRTLDLYRLFNCVQVRGGYEVVCQEKLWAQIGRELGYSGRIMSSLSTSLRLAYAKVLLGYEQYMKDQGRATFLKTGLSSELKQTVNHEDPSKDVGVFKVTHSAAEYKILRDLKKMKCHKTHFDSLTETLEGITNKNEQTLPSYDFNFWQSGSEIYDSDPTSCQFSPIYNLRQYHEKSERHCEGIRENYGNEIAESASDRQELKQSTFEMLFFKILSSEQDPQLVDTGMNLESSVHNFGSCFMPKTKNQIEAFHDPWNLDNVPLQENSLLRYLDIDFRNYSRTTVDIGMLFSVQGWQLNGNFLPSVNYNHLGSDKLWYVIRPEDMEKFERLVENIDAEARLESNQTEPSYLTEKSLEMSDFYKCYSESALSFKEVESAAKLSNVVDGDTVASSSESYAGDLQLHPKLLEKYGIRLLRVSQECGSYIFKFPRVYTSNIASGFHVSENALFAPLSWLDNLLGGVNWFHNNGMLPGILPFQFLLHAASDKKHVPPREATAKILKELAKEELENRSKVRKILGEGNYVDNKFDYISDSSMKPTGGSKIVVADTVCTRTFTCREFLEMVTKNEYDENIIFGQKIGLVEGIKAELHIYCSDETLVNILADSATNPKMNSSEGEDYRSRLDRVLAILIKGGKIPLANLESLDSGINFQNTGLAEFEDLLLQARNLRKDCDTILSSSSSSPSDQSEAPRLDLGEHLNLAEPIVEQGNLDLIFLKLTVDKINKIRVEFPEMLQILKLSKEVDKFELHFEKSLGSKDFSDMQHAYLIGRSLNIAKKYLEPLIYWMCQSKWLENYKLFFENDDGQFPPAYTVHELHSFFKYGIKYAGADHIEKLSRLREIIIKSQKVVDSINNLLTKKQSHKVLRLKDVKAILKMTLENNLPIDTELITTLKSMVDAIDEAKIQLTPVLQKIDVNEPFEQKLIESIKNSSKESLQLLDNFNGSENDKRIVMSDVQDQKFFNGQVKACKSWISKINKIFTKSKREKLRSRISTILDVKSDLYGPSKTSLSSPNQETYCICRQGEIGGTMIECEICKEWYHTGCIASANWKLPQNPSDVFVCSICSPKSGDDHDPENSVEYSIIESLVLESIHLKLVPDRQMLNDVVSIFQALFAFKSVVLEELPISQDKGVIDVPLNKIKHYLRKLANSNCRFSPWHSILEAHCREQNLKLLEDLKSHTFTDTKGTESIIETSPAPSA